MFYAARGSIPPKRHTNLAQQRRIASATGRFDEACRQIARLGEWSGKACID